MSKILTKTLGRYGDQDMKLLISKLSKKQKKRLMQKNSKSISVSTILRQNSLEKNGY